MSSLSHVLLAAIGALTTVVGCASGSAPGASADGPGARIISDIVACKKETDCDTAAGETCGQGFCQMKRCSSKTYTSLPPLGQSGYAYTDRALIIAADKTGLDVVSSHTQAGATIAASAAPADVAGGNLTGTRPESIAYITANASNVSVVGVDGKNAKSLPLGFAARRIATGDVDGDGIAEIVAVGDGQYALCSVPKGTCAPGTISDPVVDVAVGDIDGDGLGEILFYGNNSLTIIDVDTGKVSTQPIQETLANITAGDLDGDGTDEVIGNTVGGMFSNDVIHVYKIGPGVTTLDFTMPGYDYRHTSDVQYVKRDNKGAVDVLVDASNFKSASLLGLGLDTGAIVQLSDDTLASGSGKHLAAADVAGRSAMVALKGPAAMEVGPVVPVAVLTFPPYSATHSAGPSSVNMGENKGSSSNEGNGKSTSVSMSFGGSIGINLGKAVGLDKLGVDLSASVSKGFSHSQSRSSSTSAGGGTSVGGSYSLSAEPGTEGYNSGGVVLGGGCFHKYEYTVDDPQNMLQSEAKDLTMFVPVGGETSVWSTARYNALADAMGDGRLPKVQIQPKLGNIASYPSTPTRLDGQPIATADNVFTDVPVFRSSDTASVSFNMSKSTNQSTSTSTSFSYGESTSYSVSGGFKLISASANYSHDSSWSLDASYSVSIDQSTSFSGSIAPVKDDPSTPANESTLYAYSFKPYVYLNHYTDKNGNKGAFYALTYTVSQ